MALNIWSGAYLDRYEDMNSHFDASVEAAEATDVILKNNVISGCERVGYHMQGQACTTAPADLWSGNEVSSVLIYMYNQ